MVVRILGSPIGGKQARELELGRAADRRPDGLVGALSRGAGVSAVMLGAGTAIGFGLQLLIARTLGVQEYAIYTVAAAWLGILAIVSRLGYDNALCRFLPAYRARREWSDFRELLRASDRATLFASLTIAATGLVVTWLWRARLGEPLALALAIGLATVPVLARLGLRQAALRALQCMAGAMCPESVVKQFILAGVVLLAVCLGAGFTTAPWIMAGNLLATAAALWLAGGWWVRVLRGAANSAPFVDVVGSDKRSEWAGVSKSFWLMTLINLVLTQADVLLLGVLADVRQAGVYAVASRLAGLAGFGLLAVNTMLAPLIAELHATGERQALQRVVTRGARGALLAMLLSGASMAALGRPLLGWFGAEFRDGYGALLILLAGHAASTIAGSVGFLMTMTGHEQRALIVIGGGAVLNVVLHLTLIPQFGMLGAATATAAATLVWNSLLVVDAWRRLRIDPTSLGRFALQPPRARPCPDPTF